MPTFRDRLEASRRGVLRDFHFVVGTFAASGVGYLGSVGAPVIVQALIESGLNYQQAGDLGTIELTMLAVASVLVTPYAPRISHRKLAMRGALLAMVGLVVSASSVSFDAMVVGRIITGIGSGLGISGANAAIAVREDAERIFAIIWTLGGGVTASLSINLPRFVQDGNYPMGFGVLLLLCVVGLPLMLWIPHRPAPMHLEVGIAPAGGGGAEAEAMGRSPRLFGLMTLMPLLGIFIYSVAEQALWNFAYNLPIEAGVPGNRVNWVLGFTTFMGLAGGAIAAWLGTRLGRVFPIVAGSLLSMTGRWIYLDATGVGSLFAGGLLWGIGFYFVSPYQIGLMAALDRAGRVAVAAGGMMNFGYAVGPMVGGRILQHLDLGMLTIVVVGATLLSMLLLLPLAIRVDRAAREAPAVQPPGG